LIRKRAEIAGEVKQIERSLKAQKAMLATLDKTIRMFAPEFNTRGIKPVRPKRHNPLFAPGEVARFIRDYMREHPEPVTAHAIAAAAMTAKGLPGEMLKPVSALFLAALRAMVRTGGVRREGIGRAVSWRM
jgi:hypothetical protein